MDKIIEKKKGIARAFTLKALPYWLGSAVAVLLIILLARSKIGRASCRERVCILV